MNPIPLWCPLYWRTVSPDAISQRRATWSEEAKIKKNEASVSRPTGITARKLGFVPVTRYAESALKAQSHTHRWCPFKVFSDLNSQLRPIDQILTVVSAEHVARYLLQIHERSRFFNEEKVSHLTSGLRRHLVRYLLCAWNFVIGWNRGYSEVSSLIFHT